MSRVSKRFRCYFVLTRCIKTPPPFRFAQHLLPLEKAFYKSYILPRLKQTQLSASFVQREVARLAVTEGLFFQILTFLPLFVTVARKSFVANFTLAEVARGSVTEGLFFVKIFRLTTPLCHPERSESGVEPVGRCEASGSPLNLC